MAEGAEPQGQQQAEVAGAAAASARGSPARPVPVPEAKGSPPGLGPALPLPAGWIPVLCLAEAPEPRGLCRPVLLPGRKVPKEADTAPEAQPGPAAALPPLQPPGEAQDQESSQRGPVEEEEALSLPSVLTSSSSIAGNV